MNQTADIILCDEDLNSVQGGGMVSTAVVVGAVVAWAIGKCLSAAWAGLVYEAYQLQGPVPTSAPIAPSNPISAEYGWY
jgi:hypothetical protein